MNGVTWVLIAAVVFVGTHFLLSHSLRAPIVQRLGEATFQGVYSIVAMAALAWLIFAYVKADDTAPLWLVGNWLWGVVTAVMLVASVLLMGSVVRNPALPSGGAPGPRPTSARGVYAVTRHPMMWSIALWGLCHIAVFPIAKNIVVAVAMIVLALVGAMLQDQKKQRLQPEFWPAWGPKRASCRSLRSPRAERRSPALACTRLQAGSWYGSSRPGRIFRFRAGPPAFGDGCKLSRTTNVNTNVLPRMHAMPGLTEIDLLRVSRIAQHLIAHKETVAVSESSAGGLISAALLSIPGASAYFLGGGVIYTRKAMETLLELTPADLNGVRSATEPIAALLAATVRDKLKAKWGLAETGATGPTGNRYGDAAGHVCLAVAGPQNVSRTLETGSDDRLKNMVAFANAALELFEESLRKAN